MMRKRIKYHIITILCIIHIFVAEEYKNKMDNKRRPRKERGCLTELYFLHHPRIVSVPLLLVSNHFAKRNLIIFFSFAPSFLPPTHPPLSFSVSYQELYTTIPLISLSPESFIYFSTRDEDGDERKTI